MESNILNQKTYDKIYQLLSRVPPGKRGEFVARLREEFTAKTSEMVDRLHEIELGQHYEGLHDIEPDNSLKQFYDNYDR